MTAKKFEPGFVMGSHCDETYYVATDLDEAMKICDVCGESDNALDFAHELHDYVELVLKDLIIFSVTDWFSFFKCNGEYEYDGLSDDCIEGVLDELTEKSGKSYY